MSPYPGDVPVATMGAGARSRPDLAPAVIEALELPVVACDAEGRLALANAPARELWELPADGNDDHCAQHGPWFADDPDSSGPADPLKHALAGGEPTLEWRLLPCAGSPPRRVLVSAQALYDTGGNLLGAVMRILAVDREPASEKPPRDYAWDLEMLTEASRLLAEVSDPDEAAAIICTVASGATGAIAMLLWELTEGALVLRHYETGFASDDLSDLTERAHAGAARALSESTTAIEQLAADWDGVGPGDGVEAASLTVWHEPLTSGGHAVGVLSIMWAGVLEDLDGPASLIGALAHHAATALERAELLRRLGDAARTDPLTGLANRRVWQETLDHELARTQRDRRPFTLLLLDVDKFKSYNDQFGHPAGDRLLQDAATAWSQRVRRTDLLARIGGEEFAVLVPGCPAKHAHAVAEELRAAMPHGQTCSVGIVTCEGVADASELYAAADAALYRAKRQGRNRTEVGDLGGRGGSAPPPGPPASSA